MDLVYDKKSLEEMTIHVLRVIGREIGVESPTSKKKEELINAILKKVESGKSGSAEVKSQSKPHKGRPPKGGSLLIFNDVGASFRPKEESDTEDGKKCEVKILEGITRDLSDAFEEEKEPPKKPFYKKNNFKDNDGKDYRRKRETFQEESREDKEPKKEGKDSEEETIIAPEFREGVLEIMPDGYGFLRAKNYESGTSDAYVSAQKIKKCGLRKGDYVKAEARQTCENRPAGVVNVLEVNGLSPEAAFRRKNFDALTPIYPDVRYKLELPGKNNDFAIRSIDLIAPIGKGQRAMIVSPPKAGKTTLLKKIANSISANYPEAHLIVLLIDERPEEVTDMQRSIAGEVVYSTFDEMPEHHTKAAELVLERAKRLVELGKDVVILMDSLTRLARAYNLTISPTGRTLSGGIDPGALHSPKRFFGAARNIENGGSLTIIATALVDTGSRMDDVIYEEFKGTGNMEIHLDRRLSEKRIFPAIDLYRSGTRREELLLDQSELQGIWAIRKLLSAGESADATENLINMLVKSKTNKEFIEQLNLQIMAMQKQGYIM